MASGTLDLAAWRRIKAVRQGVVGSFATLWNEQVAAVWSVVRPLCGKEGEAVGWCTSFRLALEERLPQFDPVTPLPPQIGAFLFSHLAPAFRDDTLVPAEVLPATPAGLARLPAPVRLAWLTELFFDVSEDVFASEPGLLPRLRIARRGLEPVSATDLRMALRQTLALVPPEAVMMLPPGAGTPPPRRWWGLWIPGLLLMLMAIVGMPVAVQHRWDRHTAAQIHTEVIAQPPGFLQQSDAKALSEQLAAQGVARVLTEVPMVDGMQLIGGVVMGDDGPSVILEYRLGAQPCTLQHHLRPDPTGLEPFTGPVNDSSAVMEVVTEGEIGVVSWRDSAGLWILAAAVPPAELLTQTALLRQEMAAGHP